MTAPPEFGPQEFGRRVLGPVVAEFCLRLWSLSTQVARPDDAALLFCARGGLRLLQAFELFLDRSRLPAPLPSSALMVSRLVAVRPALTRTLDKPADGLVPVAAATLTYEFGRRTAGAVARALTGVDPGPRWAVPFIADRFTSLLHDPGSGEVRDVVREQAGLFTEHLHDVLDGRGRAILVDTGLYGTTGALLAEGIPDVSFGSALIARSFRPGTGSPGAAALGLISHTRDYVPWQRRTALLRHWHFVEWLFEPDLPSVRTFVRDGDRVRSDLEVDGWRDHVGPEPGTPFAGVLEHLGSLASAPAEQIVRDADRAWSELRRALVDPRAEHAAALAIGARSLDFGLDATWDGTESPGVLAALRTQGGWREGAVARSGSVLRAPVLAGIEATYAARLALRAVRRHLNS